MSFVKKQVPGCRTHNGYPMAQLLFYLVVYIYKVRGAGGSGAGAGWRMGGFPHLPPLPQLLLFRQIWPFTAPRGVACAQ